MMRLKVDAHPLLALQAFVTQLPDELGALTSPGAVVELLSEGASAPVVSSDAIRRSVRDLLRHDGFKPTGRNKPASEYLIKAAQEGLLTPINLAVDVCNAVSLHSGLPISVVDLDRVEPPLRVGVAPAGAAYVFNRSGQVIELQGLLCLFDAEGPCGNAVKDSQRTKTCEQTGRTLTLIWAPHEFSDHANQARSWYEALLRSSGCGVEPVVME
jgi:DNA/RNA-binding domain of Phe-tRNA-synthetase-like protein